MAVAGVLMVIGLIPAPVQSSVAATIFVGGAVTLGLGALILELIGWSRGRSN